MKRMWNVVALGAVVMIGLGTYAVDSRASSAEWSLNVSSNEELWTDKHVNVLYDHDDTIGERFVVTTDRSKVTTHLSYIEEALQQRDLMDPVMREFYRQTTNLNYLQTVRTVDGYVGIGQKENKEIIIYRSEGENVTTTVIPSNVSGAVDVMEGNWVGLFLQGETLHLMYRDGYDEPVTKLAVFDEKEMAIAIQDVEVDRGYVSDMFGSSWFYGVNQLPIAIDNRFIPVRVATIGTYTEDGETYTSEETRPGIYAYDVESKEVVTLVDDGEMWDAVLYDDEFLALQEDKSEIVVDLKSGESSSRKVIEDENGTTAYVGKQLYHVQQVTDGAIIDVYEDGKAVSSAAISAANDEAKALLPSTQFYVE